MTNASDALRFHGGQNNRREVTIMKMSKRFYYDLGASTTLLVRSCCSATIHVVLTKISNRSGIAVQRNGGFSGGFSSILGVVRKF